MGSTHPDAWILEPFSAAAIGQGIPTSRACASTRIILGGARREAGPPEGPDANRALLDVRSVFPRVMLRILSLSHTS